MIGPDGVPMQKITLWEVSEHIRRQITTVMIPVPGRMPEVIVWGSRAFQYVGQCDYEESSVYHM